MMKKGTARDLTIARRYGQISAQYSIQDVVDLLVELITNSDDSYRHLHEAGDADTDRGRILIEIERHRGDNDSIVSVSDRAGGIADIDAAVGRLGDKTSSTGDRGFMARGLKDCAALGHITIETIRDEEIKKAEITRDFKYIPYTAGRDPRPQKSDRRRLGIPHNGTRVEVLLKPSVSVPLKQTLMRELPWHFALRDIFTGGGVLIRVGGGKPEQLARVEPKAELIIDEEYEVPGYDGIRARFQLFRSPVALEDPPDKRFRRSGILIAGRRAVHECTFFTSELERDPAAEHYFGRLESAGIDQLADEWDQQRERGGDHPSDNPLLLFDPNRRAGLQRNHPFTTAMFSVPIELLKLQFEKDRESARKDQQTVESQETTRRLRRLAREASQFMRDQLEDLDVLGVNDRVNDQSFIDKGLVLVPSFTQIHVGAEKRFYVRVDRQLGLPMGTEVSLTLSRAANDALEVVTPPHDLEADPRYEGSQRSAFTMRAKSNTSRVQVSCQVDGLAPVFAEVQVIPSEPQDLEIPDGFAFHRNAYTVRQGGQRTLKLRARFSPRPESPTPVSFRLADERVATLRARS